MDRLVQRAAMRSPPSQVKESSAPTPLCGEGSSDTVIAGPLILSVAIHENDPSGNVTESGPDLFRLIHFVVFLMLLWRTERVDALQYASLHEEALCDRLVKLERERERGCERER